MATSEALLAGELGRLVGLHIDDATRELDGEMREMIEEALAIRTA